MKLQPVTEQRKIIYPESKAKTVNIMGRWIRRVGVAVAITSSAAFWAGCPTIGGDIAYPEYHYACEDNDPAPAPDFLFPGTFSRVLCSGQSTWAELTIEDQRSLHFELDDNSYDSYSDIQAVIVDPEGVAAGTLDDANPELDLDLTPGVWRVTVTQLSSSTDGEFSLHIDNSD